MTNPKNTSQSHVLIAMERDRAISRLRLFDFFLSPNSTTENVVRHIGRAGLVRREGETTLSYLRRFAAMETQRQFVPARTATEFRLLICRPHPRQAEIESLPHPVSMGGVGNEDNRIRREY